MADDGYRAALVALALDQIRAARANLELLTATTGDGEIDEALYHLEQARNRITGDTDT